jgi:hypothetical protein
MEPILELIDALDREGIEHARRMTFEQKFMAGAELFDYACGITKAGIRWQNPSFDEAQVMAELRRRVSMDEREIDL